MTELPYRTLLGVVLGFGLVVAGFGAASLTHKWSQECHERWDDVPDAHADCEDGLHVMMLYGGGLLGTFGLALLGAAAWDYAASRGEASTRGDASTRRYRE